MNYSKNTYSLLEKYDVDSQNGFLPKETPLDNLPKEYELWDNLNAQMTTALQDNDFTQKVEELPLLEVGELNKIELERAMLLLGTFAHAYVKESKTNTIPKQVAIPWAKVAEKLQRLPIIAHSALVLQNWRLINPKQPFHLDNLETQFSFTGTKTESWFFLATTNIEKIGAKAIPMLLESVHLADAENYEEAIQLLKKVLPICQDLLAALRKMYEFCDPTIFYNEVRGFFDSFDKVVYEGTTPTTRSYSGGSAAQSSLLQFLDMVIGMDYGQTPSRDFLLDMRNYMPYPHRTFLHFVEQEYNLKVAREKDEKLDLICKEIIAFLIEFRNEHLKIVSHYIIRPARESQKGITGTGGTNPLFFLKAVRNKNKEQA